MRREVKSPADKHYIIERINKLKYGSGWIVTITKEAKDDTGRKTTTVIRNSG